MNTKNYKNKRAASSKPDKIDAVTDVNILN